MRSYVSTNRIRQVLCKEDLNPCEKLVYLYMLLICPTLTKNSGPSIIHVSPTEIAGSISITERTIRKAITSLESKGFIERVVINNKVLHGHFYININKETKKKLPDQSLRFIDSIDKCVGGLYVSEMDYEFAKTIARKMRDSFRFKNKSVFCEKAEEIRRKLITSGKATNTYKRLYSETDYLIIYDVPFPDCINIIKKVIDARINNSKTTIILHDYTWLESNALQNMRHIDANVLNMCI